MIEPRPPAAARAIILARVVVLIGFVACGQCRAELLAHEPFAYPPGTLLQGQGSPAAGFSGTWTVGGLDVPDFAIGAAGLDDPSGRLLTSGNRIGVTAPKFAGFIRASRPLRMPLPSSNDATRYVSVLLRPEGTLGVGSANGYFGLELIGDGGSRIFVGKPGSGAAAPYALEEIGGTGQHPSNVLPVVGREVLLVLRADLALGPDTLRLYVDPLPGGPEPAFAQVVKADADVGSIHSVGLFASGTFSADEIRVGETFADVVPVPDPAAHASAVLVPIAMLLAHRRRALRR